MKKFVLTTAMLAMTTPAFAGTLQQVPEMSVGAGVSAVALLAGVAVILRERNKKK